MAPKLHHPEVMRLRNKYHMARGHQAWPLIKRLAASDDTTQQARAEAIAKVVVASSPQARALQAGSRAARVQKISFLRAQKAAERAVRAALEGAAAEITRAVLRAADASGKIPPGRLRALLEAAKAANKTAYAGVNREFLTLLKTSARGGLKAAMVFLKDIKKSLQNDREKEAQEGGNIAPAVQPIGQENKSSLDEKSSILSNPLDKTSPVDNFSSLDEESKNDLWITCGQPVDNFSNVTKVCPMGWTDCPTHWTKKTPIIRYLNKEKKEYGGARALDFLAEEKNSEQFLILEAADPLRQKVEYAVRSGVFERIFTGALRVTMEAGLFGDTGVSNKVWDLRDGNLLIIKRILTGGIADGRSAGSIAADLVALLIQPKGFDQSYGGPGIYRSAWKNAMRLARNESNRAYGAANALYAAEKEWKMIWHVSDGQREEDECDDLDGKEMTPEEFLELFPQHPNCLCYSTFSFEDDAYDDAPPEVDA